MPFKPGESRPEGAGREKGVPNKRTEEAKEIAERLGVNPLELLLLYAKGDHESLGLPQYTTIAVTKEGEPIEQLTVDAKLRQKAAKDACEYLFPKLKSVEHSGNNGTDLFAKFMEELNAGK